MKFVNTKTGVIFTSNNELVIAQMKKNPELRLVDEVAKEEPKVAKEEIKEEVKETPKKKKK